MTRFEALTITPPKLVKLAFFFQIFYTIHANESEYVVVKCNDGSQAVLHCGCPGHCENCWSTAPEGARVATVVATYKQLLTDRHNYMYMRQLD